MKTIVSIIIILIISVFSIRFLYTDGYFPMHDDTQPSRVYEMAKQLKEGQFPVRWVPDLGYGYGYPLFNFYAPLPYYVGAIFNISGFDVIDSAKIMMGIGMLTASVCMFFLAKELGGYLLGMTAALLYQFAPYHALNLYVRGAVGELFAFAFLPLAILGIVYIAKSAFKKGMVLYALGLFLVLISHNILGLISLYFSAGIVFLSVFLMLIKKLKSQTVLSLLAGLTLGFGLSAFFTLPSFFEKDYTRVSQLTIGGSNFTDHFIYLTQLWDFPWGYGGSAPGLSDGMSFKLGKIFILLAFLSLVIVLIFYRNKKKNKLAYAIFWISLLFTVISIFFTLDISKDLWQIFPSFHFIQYPWRFINFILLFLCMVISSGLSSSIRLVKLTVLLVTIVVLMVTHLKYFQPQYMYPKDIEKYTSKKSLNWDISKISDEYLPVSFIPPNSYEELISTGMVLPIDNLTGQRANSPIRTVSNTISLFSFVLLGYALFVSNSRNHEKVS